MSNSMVMELEEACSIGDLCVMKKLGLGELDALLGAGFACARAEQGLYWACKYGNIPAVRHIIDIFFDHAYGIAITIACASGNVHMVRYICETFEITAEDARKAFRYACWQGHLPIVRYLCDTFGITADDARAIHGEAFRGACASGHLPVVQYLCETLGLGAEDAKGPVNLNLRLVCALGHLDVLKYLCETLGLGAEDARAASNLALRMACVRGHLPIVQYLCKTLGLGAEDARASTPTRVVYAQTWTRPSFWEGLNIEESFAQCTSALRAACRHGHLEVVMYLCETLGLDVKDAGVLTSYPRCIIDYFEWKSRVVWIGVALRGSPWCPGQEYTKWLVSDFSNSLG